MELLQEKWRVTESESAHHNRRELGGGGRSEQSNSTYEPGQRGNFHLIFCWKSDLSSSISIFEICSPLMKFHIISFVFEILLIVSLHSFCNLSLFIISIIQAGLLQCHRFRLSLVFSAPFISLPSICGLYFVFIFFSK